MQPWFQVHKLCTHCFQPHSSRQEKLRTVNLLRPLHRPRQPCHDWSQTQPDTMRPSPRVEHPPARSVTSVRAGFCVGHHAQWHRWADEHGRLLLLAGFDQWSSLFVASITSRKLLLFLCQRIGKSSDLIFTSIWALPRIIKLAQAYPRIHQYRPCPEFHPGLACFAESALL